VEVTLGDQNDRVVAQPDAVTARIDALDGLRGFLAVIVLLHHALVILYPASDGGTRLWIDHFLPADYAVRIFFVHSGFVLALKYFRSRDVRWPTAMLVRRPFRLGLPVGAAALFAWLVVRAAPPQPFRVAAVTGQPSARFHANSFGGAIQDALYRAMTLGRASVPGSWWSMPVELYCSLTLLIALIMWNGLSASTRKVALAVYSSALVAFVLIAREAPPIEFEGLEGALRLNLVLSLAFVLGAALASIWARDPGRLDAAARRRVPIALAFGAAGALVGGFPSSLKPLVLQNEAALQVLFVVGAAVIVAIVLAWPGLRGMLQRPFFGWLGRISFFVYLIHESLQHTLMTRSFTWAYDRGVGYAVAAVGSLACHLAVVAVAATTLAATIDRVAINAGKSQVYERLGLRARPAD
jgi:peptidoglycan/LPS O-acetylase OafA/YrhL